MFKICPILSKDSIERKCCQQNCTLWDDQEANCTIKVIAKLLKGLPNTNSFNKGLGKRLRVNSQ